MPDPDRIQQLFKKATAAARAMPGRSGRLVRLIECDEVMVAGDLHGQVGHFQEVLNRAKLDQQPRRHLVLQEVIHGPHRYPDGSDKSHQLLDLVAALKVQYPTRVHFLPGNHEFAQITGRPIARTSGELNSLFHAGLIAAYGDRAGDIAACYSEFIFASPLGIRTPNRVFLSHSLPPAAAKWNCSIMTEDFLSPEALQPGGDAYQVIWGRDLSLQAVQQFLAAVDADLLITGHIPCPEGFQTPNELQLVLDAQEPPAAYCLFSTDRPLTHRELVQGVSFL